MKIKKGDTGSVKFRDGTKARVIVSEIQTYDASELPSDVLFTYWEGETNKQLTPFEGNTFAVPLDLVGPHFFLKDKVNMKIEQVVRRKGKLQEYEKVFTVSVLQKEKKIQVVKFNGKQKEFENVFTVSLTQKEKNIVHRIILSEIKRFVKKSIAASLIDITPVYQHTVDGEPMVTVTLASQNKLLFIIDYPKKAKKKSTKRKA